MFANLASLSRYSTDIGLHSPTAPRSSDSRWPTGYSTPSECCDSSASVLRFMAYRTLTTWTEKNRIHASLVSAIEDTLLGVAIMGSRAHITRTCRDTYREAFSATCATSSACFRLLRHQWSTTALLLKSRCCLSTVIYGVPSRLAQNACLLAGLPWQL